MKNSLFKRFNLIFIILIYILNMNIKVTAYDISSMLNNSLMNVTLLNNEIVKEKEENDIDNIQKLDDFKAVNCNSNNEKCNKRPEAGDGNRIFSINDKVNIIDEKDGFVILDYNNKLYWCNLRCLEKRNGTYKFKEKILLHEVKEECVYKKNQILDIKEEHNGYFKVKTPDGYYGWINSNFSKNTRGINYTTKEIKVYYTADLAQMDKMKSLKVGENLRKVDERDGYYLVEAEGKMSWCSKEEVQATDKSNNNLVVNNKTTLHEASYSYVYKKGEKIEVIDGSDSKAIKVRLPDKSTAWILRDYVSYDNNRSLVASKEIKAYHTESKEENSITDLGNRIVNVASLEEGYVEGEGNKTKYGDWYGINSEWCAIFVSWCANQAGISKDKLPKHSYCMDGVDWFIQNKCWYDSSQYTPKKGDIVYFYQGNGINHVGIVVDVTGDEVVTIEGNMSNKVLKIHHKINDASIAGYGSLICY